jgi:hypothetical protein
MAQGGAMIVSRTTGDNSIFKPVADQVSRPAQKAI